ncbi:MAG: TetR/AcrR family transcriptional regulator, partial [Bdellovibrionales bacterium]|nr:TetR/AcrR family transcriptional regulator [Bdellovibrionales bacterium]
NVPDLSKESKCSVGSIYHHFRNKEEVAAALYEVGIGFFRVSLKDTIDSTADISEIVKTIVRFFLNFTESNIELSKYLWLARHSEFMTGEIRHPTKVGYDDLGRLLTKTLKSGIREKRIRQMKANILWSILFGMPLSYARDWLDGYNSEPPSKVADTFADACWRALRAD